MQQFLSFWMEISCLVSSTKEEYDVYINEPRIIFSNKFDVIEWWRNNQGHFPILASIAKNYLCIQSTSVPSEVTKLRNQLNPETMRKLMCLKSWYGN